MEKQGDRLGVARRLQRLAAVDTLAKDIHLVTNIIGVDYVRDWCFSSCNVHVSFLSSVSPLKNHINLKNDM